jgi:hypothetical protein
LLKTKVKPQFDSPVDRTVEAFFLAFQGFNQAQFQPCFLVFAVRSAEGCNALKAARRNDRRASNRHPERAVQPEHQFQFEAEGRNPERSRRGKIQIGAAHRFG